MLRRRGRFTAQDRPVIRVPEPNYTIDTNGDAVYTVGTDKSPICATSILEYPGVLFMPEDGMLPGHTGIIEHDVGRRIPA